MTAGDHDQSLLSTRGPDWWTDGYTLSPGEKSLLTLFGAEHSQGGIHAYGGIPQTTAESPALVALVQRITTAYLRSALGVDETSLAAGARRARARRAPARSTAIEMNRSIPTSQVSFGIATAPQQVSYHDILRVWREADTIPQIEHAWLFDHLLPIGGDPNGPIFEGWTLLSALAAQTERLRLGLLVTSNRFRPPAMLAKIAATVDVVSDGRLDFGIGVGSRPNPPAARREYPAHGLPYLDFADAVESLAEACTVIRRLWTEDEPFDFDGTYVQLTGAIGNPKPVQRPHPPIMIGGRTTATLRVVAEHADLWNIPGSDLDDCIRRSALLDRLCVEIGRDPASITRSIHLRVSYDEPHATRDAIAQAIDAGFQHIVLGLPAPYPENVAGLDHKRAHQHHDLNTAAKQPGLAGDGFPSHECPVTSPAASHRRLLLHRTGGQPKQQPQPGSRSGDKPGAGLSTVAVILLV